MSNNDYHSRWYAQNKDSVNAKRRDRYKNDKKFREELLASKRSTNIRIGVVAKSLGVAVCTIQDWEAQGRIPMATRTGKGHRIYTQAQISLLSDYLSDIFAGGKAPALVWSSWSSGG